MDWLKALAQCKADNISCAVVMIASVEGSAPRKTGTRMLVTLDTAVGTIGGGALELAGIEQARQLLSKPPPGVNVTTCEYNLGGSLSQCCGGKLVLQFDCHLANDFIVHVFGAGHVAQEVARLMLRLPCAGTFHDSRPDWLERMDRLLQDSRSMATPASRSSVSGGTEHHEEFSVCPVKTRALGDNPFAAVEACEPGSYFLIMTHSHELDLELAEAVLSRADSMYCGVIASKSKAASFRSRLQRKGFSKDELKALTAPLGKYSKTGNTPMEVAIAGIGDILDARQRGEVIA